MSFDNLCKLLAEKHPLRFATWVLGEAPTSVKILKTELSIEPIRADSVIFLQAAEKIVHLEFQTTWASNPPMPLRLLDYWVRLYRLYRLPVSQTVVVLLPPTDDTKIETLFETETTRHSFQVIQLWQQDPEPLLQDPVLLPFAVLAQTQNREALLGRVAQQVEAIAEMQERREVSAYVQLMAGLKYDREEIRQIFREGMMRESVIYQEILQEGEAIGRQEGRQEGEAIGRQEGEAIGRQEGEAIGRQAGERLGIERVALNMLLKGLSPDAIAEFTGLTMEQVQQLQAKI